MYQDFKINYLVDLIFEPKKNKWNLIQVEPVLFKKGGQCTLSIYVTGWSSQRVSAMKNDLDVLQTPFKAAGIGGSFEYSFKNGIHAVPNQKQISTRVHTEVTWRSLTYLSRWWGKIYHKPKIFYTNQSKLLLTSDNGKTNRTT